MPRKQLPERLRMRLDAVRAADDQDRIVQHLKRALHFRREVHMAGRIQQCDRCIRQRQLCLFGKNRDAALPFERESIQKGIPMIHAAELFQSARLIQQRLGQGRFSRVHMSKNADYKSFHNFLLGYLFILL